MAAGTTNGTDSGLSLPNAPARVYAIGFGDLFDATLAPSATFRPTALQFLADIAAAGGTGPSGATTLPSYQIITGPYEESQAVWASTPLAPPGTPMAAPTPIFTKLDPSVVEEEIRRLEDGA